MIRFVLAVAIALSLSPSQLYAQSSRFTVTATTANVYQAPSERSPVIGHGSENAVLDVRSEATDWIEVAWPNAAKGVAYVRAATGRIENAWPARTLTAVRRPMTIDEFVHGPSLAQVTNAVPASGPSNPSSAYVSEAVAAVSAASTPHSNVIPSKTTVVAPTHFVGLGGRIGDLHRSVGATGRFWSRTGVGFQLEILRDARTNTATAERVTSLQFAPGVLYALPNVVGDYLWLRPYVGGGTTIDRSTLRSVNPADNSSSSESSLGLQVFGGGEVTFAGLPRLAVSADIGYRRRPTRFMGFEPSRIRFALSGHWFVR